MRLLGLGALAPDVWRQWQPTTTAHDPNPPIPLESVPVTLTVVRGIEPRRRRAVQYLRLKGGEVALPAVAPVGAATLLLPPPSPRRTPGWGLRGTVLDAAPVADPTFPPLSRVPGRAPLAPPDVTYWAEPPAPVVAPFLGLSLLTPGRALPRPPQVDGEAPIALQGELPLPPQAAPVVPRPLHPAPLDNYQWTNLSALDPHIEDFPIAPWTGLQVRPQVGRWRAIGVAEGQVPPVVAAEPPPGQGLVGRGRPAAAEGGSWGLFWTPPDVVAERPPGGAEALVPGRAALRGPAEIYRAVANTLQVEYPPGAQRLAGPRGNPARGVVAWDIPSTLLFAVVLPPPPAMPGAGGPPRSAPRRGRTTVWSWAGYIPPPATPLPPGVSRGPFAARGHGHAPVAPYLAAYILSIPAAQFGPAELWQFPDGSTLYTFGDDGPVVWAFQADSTIWEW